MNAYLLYDGRDFDAPKQSVLDTENLELDLELENLFSAMARGDDFLYNAAKQQILTPLLAPEDIKYRQQIVEDCVKNPSVITELYIIAVSAIEQRNKEFWLINNRFLSSMLSSSISLLEMFCGKMLELRNVADNHAQEFHSKGFIRLFHMLKTELSDEYLAEIKMHMQELKFSDGMLISTEIGENGQVANYVLRRQSGIKHRWLKWRFAPSYSLRPRDEWGVRDLSMRKEIAIQETTITLYKSAMHVLGFFELLKRELAFYVGCINLYSTLQEQGLSVCFPGVSLVGEQNLCCDGLYEMTLALTRKYGIVGNELSANGKKLIIISGANQGGKTTFLRGVGQAQLMMQCGMFVGAKNFSANVCSGIFTHFKKEEDTSMKSGKLEEELSRMSGIIDKLHPHAMILFNESFSATNEREGSEIGRQVVNALLERQIKVIFVTHMYEFVKEYFEKKDDTLLSLLAQRSENGERTFKIVPGSPLKTSFGIDLYHKIFAEEKA